MGLFQIATDMIPVSMMAGDRSRRRLARRLWWHAYELVRPSGVIRVPVGRYRMQLDTHDSIISHCLIKHGVFEPNETDIVKSILRPGDCFIDCGANVGYYTLLAASIVGRQGRVFAFEPEPKNYGLLSANVWRNRLGGFVTVVQAALGADDYVELYLDRDNLGAHSICAENLSAPRGESVSVNSFAIDSICAIWPKVKLIKIDTQGAEPTIIAGAMQFLKRDKPAILIEWWPWALRNRVISPVWLPEMLRELGYSAAIIGGEDRATLRPIEWDELLLHPSSGDPDFAPTLLCAAGPLF